MAKGGSGRNRSMRLMFNKTWVSMADERVYTASNSPVGLESVK